MNRYVTGTATGGLLGAGLGLAYNRNLDWELRRKYPNASEKEIKSKKLRYRLRNAGIGLVLGAGLGAGATAVVNKLTSNKVPTSYRDANQKSNKTSFNIRSDKNQYDSTPYLGWRPKDYKWVDKAGYDKLGAESWELTDKYNQLITSGNYKKNDPEVIRSKMAMIKAQKAFKNHPDHIRTVSPYVEPDGNWKSDEDTLDLSKLSQIDKFKLKYGNRRKAK